MEYKDKLLQEKFNSMKQLDRIELQNRQIQINQNYIVLGILMIVIFISICFLGLLSFIDATKYKDYSYFGVEDLAQDYLHHLSIVGVVLFLFGLVSLIMVLSFFRSINKLKEEELDSFIEEHTK